MVARAIAIAVTVTLVGGGCSIEPDSGPRDIRVATGEDADEDETPVTATSDATVWLVSGGGSSLLPVRRSVSDTAGNVLGALFEGPTEAEADTGITSALTGIELLETAVQADQVTVDVGLGLLLLDDADLLTALAQVVLTATEVEGVASVAITVEGEPQVWQLADGTLRGEPLRRDDFE